jgi:hypothetical protein
MAIYRRIYNYRTIYKNAYGPIPIDADGRTYEIHHIDGDHRNNHPDNLRAVTIREHYDIHYAAGDWGACMLMAARMNKPPGFLKELSNRRIADKTHNWLDSESQRQNTLKLVAEGRHPGQLIITCPHCGKSGGKPGMVKSHFDNCVMVNPVECPYCKKIGSKGGMQAWHFDRCRFKPDQ